MFIDEILNKVLSPFRQVWSKWTGVQRVKSGVQQDIRRVKGLKDDAVKKAKQAKEKAGKAVDAAKGAKDKAAGAAAQAQGAAGQVQGAVGQAQGAAANGQTKAKKKMGLFGKKNVCPNCGQAQDKSWDKCPFCANVAAAVPGGVGGGMGAAAPPTGAPPPGGGYAPAPAAGGSAQKTVMFQAGGGAAGGQQLLGWIIPLKGPHRGELHTLKASSTIGKEQGCDVLFADPYMSGRHATIRAQGGVFVLEDHSTNGTFVNDKKVKTHELVDNDFVKFGQTLVKFKVL
jgi:FHA domain